MSETIVSENTYYLLVMGGSLTLIISVIMLIANIFSRTAILEESGRYVIAKHYKDLPDVKKFYRRKKIGIIVSSLLMFSFIGLVIAGNVTGEIEAHSEIRKGYAIERLKEKVSNIGSMNLTDEQYESLYNNTETEFELTLPNGTKETGTIIYGFSLRCFCDSIRAENIEGFSEKVKNRSPHLSAQLIAQEFYDLQDKYGISLTKYEITELGIPYSKPETLTTYGTISLTVLEEDGNYYNGPVTLIWDNGLKLIKNSNPDGTFKELDSVSGD